MPIGRIKTILIASILWVIITQMLYVVVFHSDSHVFFLCSFIGQCTFLFGLFLLDRHTKSILSRYYAFMLCISLASYILRYLEVHNIFVFLGFIVLFLFALYRYLQIFTRISGQALFVRSFYTLIFCMLVGFIVFISSAFMRLPQIAPFVLGAMVLPALFMYLVALFSLRRVSLEYFDKKIT